MKGRRIIRGLVRALRLVWSSAPGWATANLLLVLFQGLLPLAGLYLLKQVIDALQSAIASPAGAAGFRPVLLWVALAAGAALLTALARALAELTRQAQALVLTDRVTDVLHGRSIAADLGYYEDPRYHDSLHRAQGEALHRPAGIVGGLIQVGQALISLAGVAGLLFAFNPLLALALLALALPGALVQVAFARRRFRFEQEQTENERRAQYYHWLLTGTPHARELRLFGLGTLFRKRFRGLRDRLRAGRLALTRRRVGFGLLVQFATTLAIFAALGFVAHQAYRGAITIGGLVMYFSAFQLAVGSFSSVLGGLAGLYEDSLFLDNLYRFLDLEPQVTAPARPEPVPERFRRGVEFRSVSFAYPGDGRPVLESVDLAVAPGQVVALVGENGSGKTTLVKLLGRLYDPDSGCVTVDGLDIRRFDPDNWRRRISVVLQDFVRYYLPAWENIWLGDVSSGPDRKRVVAAARRAGADAAIERLPRGYDTQLGCWFESGRELSSGEWQKVALARAFLRDAQLVVLDEPTSSLDPLAEAELFERFRRSIENRSALLISHRFSTVALADYIYVLDRGRVAERGTHAELLERGGLYARMYRAQASHYR
ncbi:ABC transporter ATP-binding protein [candidate division WOR-3 bacterium]|nr:ABC transporter ATP-binding protein [candidate division WOR-3 bacterium]